MKKNNPCPTMAGNIGFNKCCGDMPIIPKLNMQESIYKFHEAAIYFHRLSNHSDISEYSTKIEITLTGFNHTIFFGIEAIGIITITTGNPTIIQYTGIKP